MSLEEPKKKPYCKNCGQETERKRVGSNVKKWGSEWLRIKVFECQNCKYLSISIEKSDWVPDN